MLSVVNTLLTTPSNTPIYCMRILQGPVCGAGDPFAVPKDIQHLCFRLHARAQLLLRWGPSGGTGRRALVSHFVIPQRCSNDVGTNFNTSILISAESSGHGSHGHKRHQHQPKAGRGIAQRDANPSTGVVLCTKTKNTTKLGSEQYPRHAHSGRRERPILHSFSRRSATPEQHACCNEGGGADGDSFFPAHPATRQGSVTPCSAGAPIATFCKTRRIAKPASTAPTALKISQVQRRDVGPVSESKVQARPQVLLGLRLLRRHAG